MKAIEQYFALGMFLRLSKTVLTFVCVNEILKWNPSYESHVYWAITFLLFCFFCVSCLTLYKNKILHLFEVGHFQEWNGYYGYHKTAIHNCAIPENSHTHPKRYSENPGEGELQTPEILKKVWILQTKKHLWGISMDIFWNNNFYFFLMICWWCCLTACISC